jgi:hypothetical protein
MGFKWGDIGRELEGAFKPDKILDALNPINSIGKLGDNFENSVTSVGGVINKTVDKVSGSFNGLINMLPLILLGGGLILIMTKK